MEAKEREEFRKEWERQFYESLEKEEERILKEEERLLKEALEKLREQEEEDEYIDRNYGDFIPDVWEMEDEDFDWDWDEK